MISSQGPRPARLSLGQLASRSVTYHVIAAVFLFGAMTISPEARAQSISQLRFEAVGDIPFPGLFHEFQRGISELSKDRLTMEYPKFGAFGSTRNLIAAVQKGSVDGGIAPLRDVLRKHRDGEEMAYDRFPGLALGHAAAIRLDRKFRPAVPDFIESNLEILLTIPGDPLGLFAHQPIKSLKDLNGVKFAAFDRPTTNFAEGIGAKLVSTDIAEFDAAIGERADVFLASARFVPPRRDDRVHFQNFYPLRAFVPIYAVFVNRSLLNNRLTEDQREVLRVAAGQFERQAWKDQVRRGRAALDTLIEKGVEVAVVTFEIQRDLKELGWTLLWNSAKTLGRLIGNSGYEDFPAVDCQAVTIFFATNRKRTDGGDPSAARFGFEPDDRPSYGRVEIGLPYREPHQELPKKLRCDHGPVEDITLFRRMVLNEAEFLRQVKAAASSGPGTVNAVLIHGYGNDFDDAAMLASEFVHDMDRGARYGFMFTWPSEGSPWPDAYLEDEDRVRSAPSHLAEFVDKLSGAIGVDVALVAHSLGSRALVTAVNELHARRAAPVQNQLIFIAADVDESSFRTMNDAIRDAQDRTLTLYSSDNDLALWASKLNHPSQGRVGLIDGTPFNMPPFEVVDISSENSSLLGHSYLRVEPIVRIDVGRAIRSQDNALARGLYPRSRHDVKVYTFRQ